MRSLVITILALFAVILSPVCNSQSIEAFSGCNRSGTLPGFAEFGMFRYRNNILKTLENDSRCRIVRTSLPNSKSGIEFVYNEGRDYILDLPGNNWTYYLYFGEYPKPTTLEKITIQLRNISQHDQSFHLSNLDLVINYFTQYLGFMPTIKHKGSYDYYCWESGVATVSFMFFPGVKELPFVSIESK